MVPTGSPVGQKLIMPEPAVVLATCVGSKVGCVQLGPVTCPIEPVNWHLSAEKVPPEMTYFWLWPVWSYVYHCTNRFVVWSVMVIPQPDSFWFHQLSE